MSSIFSAWFSLRPAASRLLTCPMQSNLKRLKLSYGLLRNTQLYDLQCLVNAIVGRHPESETAAHMHANAYSEPVQFSVTAQHDKSLWCHEEAPFLRLNLHRNVAFRGDLDCATCITLLSCILYNGHASCFKGTNSRFAQRYSNGI